MKTKIYLFSLLLLIFCIQNLFAQQTEGIWQTETESEFQIRLILNKDGTGNVEWRAKNMNDSSVSCSTRSLKWERDGDFLIVSTANEVFRYIVAETKDYLNNRLVTLLPFDNSKDSSFFSYRFYKFKDLERFKNSWNRLNCIKNH